MSRLTLRPYEEADRAAVLAIFDSNLPDYFGPGERDWFEDSLDELDGPAFVATVDGRAVAFGGYEIWDYYNKALLFWGMADRAHHGSGLGRLLLFERLVRIAEETEPKTRWVTVDTSPQVSPFFQHCGFELSATWEEGYRSGWPMHELRFDLAATSLEALRSKRDVALSAAEARLPKGEGGAR